MISTAGGRVSRLANRVIDDGDDLHISASFCPVEEASSTIGNTSYVSTPKNNLLDHLNFPASPKNTEVCETLVTSTESSSDELLKHAKKSNFPNRLMPSRLWAWRRGRLAPLHLNPLNVRRQSKVDEYQEFEDPPPTPTPQLEKAESFRSHRLDVADGRTLLRRQNAQVMGRPSMAQAEWDVGSYFSAGSSGSRRRVMSLDNSNCCGFSQISVMTDDLQSVHSHPSRVMLTSPRSLLGVPPIEVGTDDEDEHDENRPPKLQPISLEKCAPSRDPISQRKKFSKLEDVKENEEIHWKGNKAAFQADKTPKEYLKAREVVNNLLKREEEMPRMSRWDFFTTSSGSSGEWPVSPLYQDDNIRERIFSDSDILFEKQRQRSTGFQDVSDSSPSTAAFSTLTVIDTDMVDDKSTVCSTSTTSSPAFGILAMSASPKVSGSRSRKTTYPTAAFGLMALGSSSSEKPRQRLHSDSDTNTSPPKSTLFRNKTDIGTGVSQQPHIFADTDKATSGDAVQPIPRSKKDKPLEKRRSRKFSDSELTTSSGVPLFRPLQESRRNSSESYEPRRTRFYSESDVVTSNERSTKPSTHWHAPNDRKTQERCRIYSDSEITTVMTPSMKNFSLLDLDSGDDEAEHQGQEAILQDHQHLPELSSPNALSAARMIASALNTSAVSALKSTTTPTAAVPTTNSRSLSYYWNDDARSDEGSASEDEMMWAQQSSNESFDLF
jgi:hypothetical protein